MEAIAEVSFQLRNRTPAPTGETGNAGQVMRPSGVGTGYASGLASGELRGARLEHLHLEAGFLTVIGKGNKERVVPVGRKAIGAINRYLEAGRPKLLTSKSPANLFLNRRRSALCRLDDVDRIKAPRAPGRDWPQHHAARVAPQFCHAFAGERR